MLRASFNVDNPEKPLACLSLCTGYGGIERGLELAGVKIRVVAHVEIEAYAVANLVAKMEQNKMVSAPIWTNLKTLNAEPFRDRIDLITGGYPCQPFSAAGRRKGKADPRHLWPYIIKLISRIRPRDCFFENVEGHLSLGFKEVARDLGRLGYDIAAGLFSAAEVGAPHRRKRLFILAHSDTMRRPQPQRSLKEFGGRAIHGGEAMADTKCGRFKGRGEGGPRANTIMSYRWPAGPGLAQFQWESPRILGDTSGEGLERAAGEGLQNGINGFASDGEKVGPRTIEFKLGRTTNGPRSRADRLRLLGNGVVPQTAALAWQTLSENLNASDSAQQKHR